MPASLEELIGLQDAQPAVKSLLPAPTQPSLINQAFGILDDANAKVPFGRKVLRSDLAEVVNLSLNDHQELDDNDDAQNFAVLRDVTNFIRIAQDGPSADGVETPYTDYLPVGNPMSTARAAGGITASAYRDAVAEWEAGHPKLNADLRPVVASAFRAEPGTVEYMHATARMRAARPGLIPSDILADL